MMSGLISCLTLMISGFIRRIQFLLYWIIKAKKNWDKRFVQEKKRCECEANKLWSVDIGKTAERIPKFFKPQ